MVTEKKIKTGSFKYVKLVQTGENVCIEMTVDGVKYAVPMKEGNHDYDIIKRLSDAGTISIAAANNPIPDQGIRYAILRQRRTIWDQREVSVSWE